MGFHPGAGGGRGGGSWISKPPSRRKQRLERRRRRGCRSQPRNYSDPEIPNPTSAQSATGSGRIDEEEAAARGRRLQIWRRRAAGDPSTRRPHPPPTRRLRGRVDAALNSGKRRPPLGRCRPHQQCEMSKQRATVGGCGEARWRRSWRRWLCRGWQQATSVALVAGRVGGGARGRGPVLEEEAEEGVTRRGVVLAGVRCAQARKSQGGKGVRRCPGAAQLGRRRCT